LKHSTTCGGVTKKIFVLIILVLLAAPSHSRAQKLVPKARLILNLDYAKFRNDDSSGFLEVYYGFYPGLVAFEQAEGRFSGFLKVHTRVKDTRSGSYVVNRLSGVPVVIKDTSLGAMRSTFVSMLGLVLPFGEYVLEVVVVDSLVPTRRDSLYLPLAMRSHGSTVSMSDIELCSNIKQSDQQNDLFFKNSLEVMPNPTLVFGVSSHPMMFNYSEIYNLDPQKTYSVKTQILGQDGKVVKESSKARKYGVKNAVEPGTTNVASIQSGRYRFRIFLADEAGVTITQTEKTFYLYNPHIQVTQVAAASVKATELAGMSAEELADEFRRAQYIATDQEVRTFGQITSEEGRREFLAKFWSEVENGRLGRPPLPRMAYLQRVLAAGQRFRSMNRDGWRTDRGRILVLYAEPDEIERFPTSSESKPYEIWHYYSIENGVEFVFVDRSGFGEYQLVHSTKRGELRDDDWQRFLQ
jgi:GWxTD domain-containing protein